MGKHFFALLALSELIYDLLIYSTGLCVEPIYTACLNSQYRELAVSSVWGKSTCHDISSTLFIRVCHSEQLYLESSVRPFWWFLSIIHDQGLWQGDTGPSSPQSFGTCAVGYPKVLIQQCDLCVWVLKAAWSWSCFGEYMEVMWRRWLCPESSLVVKWIVQVALTENSFWWWCLTAAEPLWPGTYRTTLVTTLLSVSLHCWSRHCDIYSVHRHYKCDICLLSPVRATCFYGMSYYIRATCGLQRECLSNLDCWLYKSVSTFS